MAKRQLRSNTKRNQTIALAAPPSLVWAVTATVTHPLAHNHNHNHSLVAASHRSQALIAGLQHLTEVMEVEVAVEVEVHTAQLTGLRKVRPGLRLLMTRDSINCVLRPLVRLLLRLLRAGTIRLLLDVRVETLAYSLVFTAAPATTTVGSRDMDLDMGLDTGPDTRLRQRLDGLRLRTGAAMAVDMVAGMALHRRTLPTRPHTLVEPMGLPRKQKARG